MAGVQNFSHSPKQGGTDQREGGGNTEMKMGQIGLVQIEC